MNYLSHAFRHLDRPYFAAGTALPDWMSLLDRKNRARRQYAEPVIDDPDSEIAEFAKGVLRHHDDDRWFHGHPEFIRLSTELAVATRTHLEDGLGHQAGFLGHIAVELILDSVLTADDPRLVDRYFDNLKSLSADKIQQAANLICRKPVTKLSDMLPRFINARFLADYEDDRLLLSRLNGVMKRVKLPPLPESVSECFAEFRPTIRAAAPTLLYPPDTIG